MNEIGDIASTLRNEGLNHLQYTSKDQAHLPGENQGTRPATVILNFLP